MSDLVSFAVGFQMGLQGKPFPEDKKKKKKKHGKKR